MSTVVIRLEDPSFISKNVLKNHRGVFYLEIPLFFGPKYKTPLFLPCDMTCKPLDVTLVSILVHDNYTHVGSRML